MGPGLRRRCSGLSLLEVLAATAVLLTTCAALTSVVATATRATGRAERLTAADQALLAEAARLRALPFFAPGAVSVGSGGEGAGCDVVTELFPHADPSRDGGGGRYVASGDRAGSFVTSVTVDGVDLTRVARWGLCSAGGWRVVGAESLQGWDAATGVPLPGESLVVTLLASPGLASSASLAADGRRRALTLVLSTDGGAPAIGAQASWTVGK